MKLSENAPGKDVLSYCGVCKLAMNHVIVNMKGQNIIGHCECLTCHARHPYRDPTLPKSKLVAKTRIKTVSIPVEQLWAREINNADDPPKPYSINSSFAEQDLIEHPKFGKGIVKKIMEGNKIQVLFESDLKILMHKNSA